MKRSEMVQHFIRIVRDNCFDEGFELTQEEASSMLAEIEKLGMMPPGQEKDLVTARTMDGKLIGQTYEKYEWEPEDKKVIKVKKDKKGNAFLDIKDFSDFVDIKKVKQYKLEEVDDDGTKALILTFYDQDGNVVEAK